MIKINYTVYDLTIAKMSDDYYHKFELCSEVNIFRIKIIDKTAITDRVLNLFNNISYTWGYNIRDCLKRVFI